MQTATHARKPEQGQRQTARPAEAPARQQGVAGPQAAIMALQRTAGNQAVGQMLGATANGAAASPQQDSSDGQPLIQRKLTIGASNDSLEQEADRVSDQVMSASAHTAVSTAPPHIQRLSGPLNGQMDAAPASVDQTLASPGRPLELGLRHDMEQRFSHDFSRVRVHSDAAAEQSAREVNANAYTVGYNIVFGAGQSAPGTHEGRRLIAHELTHVVQQSGSDGTRVDQGSGKGDISPISSTSLRGLQRQEAAKAADQTDLPAGPDYRSDPSYIDNVTAMSYNVLTTEISVKHQDGQWLDVPFNQVSRNVSKAPPSSQVSKAEALAKKYGVSLPQSSVPGGFVGATLGATLHSFRRVKGHIHPMTFDDESTPKIRALWTQQIEPRIVSGSRDVLFAVADLALAGRGVAGAALGPKPSAPAKPSVATKAEALKSSAGQGPRGPASDALNRTIKGVEEVVPGGSAGGSVLNPNKTRPPYVAPAPTGARPTLQDAINPGRAASPARPATPPPVGQGQRPAAAPVAPAAAPAAAPVAPPARAAAPPAPAVAPFQPAAVQATRAATQSASTTKTGSDPNSPAPAKPEAPQTVPPKVGPATDLYPRDLEQEVNQYKIAREKTRLRRDEILSKARALEAELDARTEASRQDTRKIEDESKQIGEQLTQKGSNELKGDAKDQLLKRRQEIVEENRQLIAEREQLQSNKQRVRQAARAADDEYIKGVSDSARLGAGHAAAKTRAGNKDEVFGTQGEEVNTEHIVARDIIRQKPDFQILDRQQQVEVFDLPANLVRMSARANSSKGNLRWANWPESSWRQFTNDPGVIQRMARNEAKADIYIDNYMKWQLGKGKKPQSPDLEF